MDDFGLDEGFEGFDSLEEDLDTTDGLGLAESKPGVGAGLSDFEIGSEESGISTGASDFDERVISDEISDAETGIAEPTGAFEEVMPGEAEIPGFEAPAAEPEPVSLTKRIITLVVALAIAVGAGAAFQIFLWPTVGGMIGIGGADEPKLDVQAELNAAQRGQEKLQKELREFKQIGGPNEVKTLQNEIVQVRQAQGSMEEFEATYNTAKEKEAAYDALLAKIDELGNKISEIREDIAQTKTEIEKSQISVARLANQSEREYERFRLELVRAELGHRLLIELQTEDIESLRNQLAELRRALSGLSSPASAITRAGESSQVQDLKYLSHEDEATEADTAQFKRYSPSEEGESEREDMEYRDSSHED